MLPTDWTRAENRRQRWRWLCSTCVIIMWVASSVYASRLWHYSAPPPGSPPVAMLVTLAPQLQAAQEPQAVAENEPPIKPQVPEPEVQPKPEPEPEPKPEPEPQPKPEPEPIPEPEPAPVPEPTPEPEPTPQPEPSPKPEPPPKPQPKPEPKPQPKPEPTPEPEAAPKPQPETKAPVTAPARQATTSTQQPVRQSDVGTVAQTPPSYRNELRRWLAQHKVYPRRARRLRQEGTVMLYFVMDRSGRVLNWEIRSSSGHELLDEAVVQLIKSANPMPPLPPSVAMQRMVVTVPIQFNVR